MEILWTGMDEVLDLRVKDILQLEMSDIVVEGGASDLCVEHLPIPLLIMVQL